MGATPLVAERKPRVQVCDCRATGARSVSSTRQGVAWVVCSGGKRRRGERVLGDCARARTLLRTSHRGNAATYRQLLGADRTPSLIQPVVHCKAPTTHAGCGLEHARWEIGAKLVRPAKGIRGGNVHGTTHRLLQAVCVARGREGEAWDALLRPGWAGWRAYRAGWNGMECVAHLHASPRRREGP